MVSLTASVWQTCILVCSSINIDAFSGVELMPEDIMEVPAGIWYVHVSSHLCSSLLNYYISDSTDPDLIFSSFGQGFVALLPVSSHFPLLLQGLRWRFSAQAFQDDSPNGIPREQKRTARPTSTRRPARKDKRVGKLILFMITYTQQTD